MCFIGVREEESDLIFLLLFDHVVHVLEYCLFAAYPSEDPMIEGVLSTYSIGDYVSANCTSGKSNPPANLTWYINGDKLGQQVSTVFINLLSPVCESHQIYFPYSYSYPILQTS